MRNDCLGFCWACGLVMVKRHCNVGERQAQHDAGILNSLRKVIRLFAMVREVVISKSAMKCVL